MNFRDVAISGLGYVDGPIRVESELIEDGFAPTLSRLGNRPGLLRALTGVVARRFFEEGVQPSQIATLAAEKAIRDAGIPRDEIGVIINASVSKDFIEPSVASAVHSALGLAPECLNFDLGNACLAFLNAMEVAGMMLERGAARHALIVSGESSRYAVEQTVQRLARPETTEATLRENFATLTLGSGGAAMVLSRADATQSPHRLVSAVSLAATENNHLCQAQPHHMVTDSAGLLKAGVALARQTWALGVDGCGWDTQRHDTLVMHQVGAVHFRTLLGELGLPLERAPVTYDEFGNMGPASIPITMAKAVESGRIVNGQRVALMGIGSGLNVSMMEVVW